MSASTRSSAAKSGTSGTTIVYDEKGFSVAYAFLRSGACARTTFFSVIMRDTPEYARRSLGSLLCFLYRLLWLVRCALNHHLDAPFHASPDTSFRLACEQGFGAGRTIRNKSEAMGSTDSQRSVRLARKVGE